MKNRTVVNFEVEAWNVRDLVRNSRGNWKELPACIVKEYEEGNILFTPKGIIFCGSLAGTGTAGMDEVILKDPFKKSTFTIVDSELFYGVFQPVDDDVD